MFKDSNLTTLIEKRAAETEPESEPKKTCVKKTGDTITADDFAKWSVKEQWTWIMAYRFEADFSSLKFVEDDNLASEIAKNLFEVYSKFYIAVPAALNQMTPEKREEFAKKRIANIRQALDWYEKLE